MLARQKSDSGERAAGNAGDIQISSNAVFGGFRVAATSERFADKPAQWVVRVSARQSTVVRFDDMSIHVAVLGGGVAGLSAAHELIERGFQIGRASCRERGEISVVAVSLKKSRCCCASRR